jgi:hypothetical protein
MWPPSQNEIIYCVLVALLVLTLAYVFWLRAKMKTSKASFALSIVAAMTTSSALFLKVAFGSEIPNWQTRLLKGLDNETGLGISSMPAPVINWAAVFTSAVLYCLLLILIYKIGKVTIKRWDGPVTVTVNDLAKNDLDNNVTLLALAEFRRLLSRRSDPLASEIAVNWRQRITEPPRTLPWHHFVRQIFEVAISEVVIPDNGWRDRWDVWVGTIYVSQRSPTDTVPLLLFVFDQEPTLDTLDARILGYSNDGASIQGAKIFAVYQSDRDLRPRIVGREKYEVKLFSNRNLLKDGLKLSVYARDLMRRFNNEVLGGTTATLRDTFVECHVSRASDQTRRSLTHVLSEWVEDKSRRQLALTADYGRGKSTAMLKFCVDWAERYFQSGLVDEKIPLLIELRGQNPAESDPLTFLSGWANDMD